jgi:hypothetical protein
MVGTTAGVLVKRTAEVGGNIGEAAKGAIEGAIEGARDIGIDAEEAASAAATGALRAAGEVGTTAVDQVQKVATGTVRGVKIVVKEPFRPTKDARSADRGSMGSERG